jgi:AcrR family transcriptional regulator
MAQRRPISTFKPAAVRARGRRERHKADIRLRLFRAALTLFAARGFAATTVEDITQAADVAKGTFFNYFPTKEHLLMEFGEMRLDILRAALKQAIEGREQVREIIYRMLHTLAQEPGESRAMARSMLMGGLRGEPCSSLLLKNLGGLHLWTLEPHLDLKKYLDTTFDFFWACVGSRKESSKKKIL